MNTKDQTLSKHLSAESLNDEDSETRDDDDEELEVSPRTHLGVISASPVPRSNRYRLDKLECQIISHLDEDGRKPFQAIARELGVDEKTVRNRVSKLREQGILNFIPTTDANKLKGCIVALVAISIRADIRNDVERLARDIASLPMVSWVGTVMGQYDLMVEVIVESWDALARFELHELTQISGIGKTDSFLVLSHYGKRGMPFVERILNPRK